MEAILVRGDSRKVGWSLSIPAVAKWCIAFAVAEWLAIPGLLRALVVFMVADYVTGTVAAFLNKKVSSHVGITGLIRKCLIILLLLICRYAEQATGFDLAVDRIGAIGYCINELISIVENCHNAGVPIPEQIVNALVSIHKLRGRAATDDEFTKLHE